MRSPSIWARRFRRRLANGRLAGERSEGGFTLVEMLVVIVILPLVIGAAAAIIISSERNSNSVQGRLSDSADAQLTAANFVRDVQGATMLTTDAGASSPTVCGSGYLFLLGMYRPASAGNALDVGYWETKLTAPSGTTYQVVRYSCTLSGSTSVVSSSGVVSQSVDSASQKAASITTPESSYGDPSTEWIPSAAITTVPASTVLTGSGDTIVLSSTRGFVLNNATKDKTLYFLADLGSGSYVLETVSCTTETPGTPGSFTGCSGGSGTIDAGTLVSQPSTVTSVQLAMNETASSYTFGLRSTPRTLTVYTGGNVVGIPGNPPSGGGAGTGSGGGGCCSPGNGGPALLTLGPGVSIQGAAGSSLTVNGLVAVNSGTLTCTGSPTATATGYLAIGGSSSVGSCATGPVTQISVGVQDPYLGVDLPFNPTPGPQYGAGQAGYAGGVCPSGTWNIPLPAGCALEPGLFVLNAGYCANNQSLTMAPGSNGQGVLLYLPAAASTCSSNAANCNGVHVPYSIDMEGNSSLNVPGLLPAQAQAIFGDTGMEYVVLWQNAINTNDLKIGGTTSGISPGTVYAPNSLVALQGNGAGSFGQIIASCVSIAGSTPLTVTGT